MKGAKYLFLILIFSLLLSCGGSDDGPGDPEPTPAPSAATLVFPEDNSECTEGTLLSDTESEVIFQWNVAQNADSYTVNLRNLNTDDERQINANTNESAIRFNRGTPKPMELPKLPKVPPGNFTTQDPVLKITPLSQRTIHPLNPGLQ